MTDNTLSIMLSFLTVIQQTLSNDIASGIWW